MVVTNSMLEEGADESLSSSSSSSEVVVPRPGGGDESVISEDDWGVLSIAGNSEHSSGELILDGVEEEGEETKEFHQKDPFVSGKDSSLDDEEAEGSQLSLSGAESVPTVVGSIDGLPTVHSTEKEETTPADETEEDIVAAAGAVDAQVQTVEAVDTTAVAATAKNRFVLSLLVVPALLLVPTIASICLYNERNSLQMSVMELEDVVSGLHLEAEQRKLEEELLWEDKEFLQLSSMELQEKVFALKRDAEKKKKIDRRQLDSHQKERATLKLYISHLQDLVSTLKKKAAKEKREGDILYQDKKFLEWSASTLQRKVKTLQLEAKKKVMEDNHRWEKLKQEKVLWQGLVAKAHHKVLRMQREADKKSKQDERRFNSLFQEKLSLRVSTARLEEQVSILKMKAKQGRREQEIRQESLLRERDALLSTVLKLEDELASLKRGAKKYLVGNLKANMQLRGYADHVRVNNVVHNVSEYSLYRMKSHTAAAPTRKRALVVNTTDLSVSQRMLKADSLDTKLWNTTATNSANWNGTKAQVAAARDVGKSVARMMRKVDSLGRALWNATAFKVHKNSNNATHSLTHGKGLSFFSRMDLNGKIWFESFFSPSPTRRARTGRVVGKKQIGSSGLDKIFQMVSDVIHSAGSADQILEEASAIFFSSSSSGGGGTKNNRSLDDAFMSSAMEKLCSAMAFNHTSKKYLMMVAQNAFEEVSITHNLATTI